VKLALAFALLASCCGCSDRPAKTDTAPATSSAPAPAPAPPAREGGAPAQSDRFIVCPGDQRCPKGKDGRPSGGAD
jgi:hypothetical protein